jgi:hypothetical protein
MKSLVLVFCLIATSALAQGEQQSGLPIDKSGGPTVDPTENVKALVIADAKRQDDLRISQEKLDDTKIKDLKEIIDLRAAFEEKLRVSEAGRLDSIRQVDRDDVAKTTAAANVAIATLAKQTTDLSTTLAKQVQDTATATEARQSAFSAEVTKRLSQLELGASSASGKNAVADPQIEALRGSVEKLLAAQQSGAGSTAGQQTLISTMVAIGILLIGAIGLLYRRSSQNGKMLKSRG